MFKWGYIMRKKIRSILFLFIVTIFAQSNAKIVKIEELYNPATRQTIILMGDAHFIKNNEKQVEDLLELITQHNNHTIIEAADQLPAGYLIQDLTDTLKQRNIPFSNPEFRWSIVVLRGLIRHILSTLTTLSEAHTLWTVNKKIIFDLFTSSIIQVKTMCIQIQKDEKVNDAIYSHIYDNLKHVSSSLVEMMKKLPPQQQAEAEEISSLASFLFDTTFTQSTHEILNNKDGVLYTLEAINDELFDVHTAVEIITSKDALILVCTGAQHTKNIKKITQKFGYASTGRISHLKQLRAQQITSSSESPESFENEDNTEIDIKAFIESCEKIRQAKEQTLRQLPSPH